jgi:phosphoribosylformimino-5-aminoimidazole carboxamide ribotide isomerase
MLLVPSISVKKGQTVRIAQGDFANETAYHISPLEVARHFEEHGITHLQLLDLDGAQHGSPKNFDTLELITGYTKLRVNFTGGLHTDGDVIKAFEYGAACITSATMAVYNQPLFDSWIMSYGREKIMLGADCLHGLIRVGGWQKDTKIALFDHIEHFYERGLKYIKTTDISRDGALQGPYFELYEQILKRFPNIALFASGGVRDIQDMYRLRDLGVDGVIFGKAYYEGRIALKELEDFLKTS